MTINLPMDPKENDYEDLVAACLTSLGYFIETSIRFRSGTTEVLEIDIVASLGGNEQDSILVEAKSGGTNFNDIFKLYGWLQYLQISNGKLVRKRPIDQFREKAFSEITDATGIQISHFSPDCNSTTELADPAFELDEERRFAIASAAWWGRIARRYCHNRFTSFSRDNCKTYKSVQAAREYSFAIETSFFAPSPLERARRLYAAYKSFPRVTSELIEDYYSDDTEACKSGIRDSHTHPEAMYCQVMEHTARLGILKNALLHMKSRAGDPTDSRFDELLLPNSFRDGLVELANNDHAERLPFFFQIFIEVFGGFIGMHNDADAQELAACSGIPSSDILDCLDIYETIFPLPNSSWYIFPKKEIKAMIATPSIYRGTGAFLRKGLYAEDNYNKIYPQMGWLVRNWHNALYNLLQPVLGNTKQAK